MREGYFFSITSNRFIKFRVVKISMNTKRIIRAVLIFSGTLSVLLGIIGIFIPILPTTPFLLLAAACYARSSVKFYNGLMNNRIFGSYIRNYRAGRGVPFRVKIVSISFLWSAISFSILFVVSDVIIRIILVVIGIAVTLHIASIRNRRKQKT